MGGGGLQPPSLRCGYRRNISLAMLLGLQWCVRSTERNHMKHVIRTTLSFVVLASLAMTAAANESHKHHQKARSKAPLAVASVAPSAVTVPMIGTWTLRNGDTPRTDIKMVFRPNGTFAF